MPFLATALRMSSGDISEANYRYLRLRITQTQNGNATGLQNCRFRLGTADYPTVNMTSNTAPSPLVSSSSTQFGPGFAAWKAFDGTTDYWATQNVDPPHWLMLDLGSGNEFVPTGLKAKIPNVPEYGLKAFVVEGSNDETSWTTIHSVSGEADWSGNEERIYSW